MYVQTLIAERTIERFNMAIVRGFAGPAEIDAGLMMVSPQVQQRKRTLKASGPPGFAVGRIAALGHSQICAHKSIDLPWDFRTA
jgi:hypothetical protein